MEHLYTSASMLRYIYSNLKETLDKDKIIRTTLGTRRRQICDIKDRTGLGISTAAERAT